MSQVVRQINRFLFSAVFFTVASVTLFSAKSEAACGATTMTWDFGAGNTRWDRANNWNPNTVPALNTHNATIIAGTNNTNLNVNTTVSCVYIQSGLLTAGARTLTVTGDYFRNLNAGNMRLTNANTVIAMAGTAAQTFENYDNVRTLQIANNTTVTFTHPFAILNALSFTGTTTTLYIDADLSVSGTAVVIPAGVTVRIRNNAIASFNTNLTVNGTLIVESGSSLLMGNTRILSVPAGGTIRLQGTSGNIAKVSAMNSSSTYTFNMAGTINANYFKIERMSAAGINVTGTIQLMDNGEFHYLPASGYAITLGAAAIVPTTLNYVGFFNDLNNAGVKNINATAFNVSSFTIDNWSGSVGGTANETDPNSRVNWGATTNTLLNISNDTAAGAPPATIAISSIDTHFATFAFTLSKADTATDITSLKITQVGTATADQIASIKLYKDAAGSKNCLYNAGVDTQVDTTKTMSGTPATVTFTLAAGDAQTNSDSNRACVHIVAATSATALNGSTIGFGVLNTADAVNSTAYEFSPSSGPPVEAAKSTVTNTSNSAWTGATSTSWNVTTNWNPRTIPTSTRDCEVGVGTSVPLVNVAQASCRNAILQAGGTLNFNSTTNQLAVYGALHIQSPYTFQNATTGVIAMRGAANQSINSATTFPGNLEIINTGTAGNNVVSIASSTTVSGTLTVTSGKLSIEDGVTFTVGGNITVATGATLTVQPGGTLRLATGRTLTVNSGGTLEIVGTASKTATITSNLSTSGYNIIVNGTISARYYTIDHLGTGGMSIEAGATINASNYLQDGSFTYPVNNNIAFLYLKRQIPGNALSNVSFALSGSAATGTKNINTTGAAAGTLTITGYSGNLAGATYHTAPTYTISWVIPTTTIDMALEASSPANVIAGSIYNMGRYSFKLAQAGSFSNTDITSLKVSLTGTGTSADITQVRLYSDSACTGSGGTQIGSGTFAGSPSSITFPISAGQVTVLNHATTPPKVCVYLEYTIAASATNAKTVGAQVTVSTDVVNSQSYSISGTTSFPLTMGSPSLISGTATTNWTGTTSTDWFTAGNWSNGLPSATKNCDISNVTNDPVINGSLGTATCKNVNITNGILTFTNATGAKLVVAGNFANTGTITWNDGAIEINDSGGFTAQYISSTPALTNVRLLKTAGGSINLTFSSLTITNLTWVAGNTGDLRIASGKTLNLGASTSIAAGTLNVQSGGILSVANGATITVNGGTLQTSGTHDVYPQNTALKGKITSPGTWGLNATSGTVNLVGFILDKLDANGLRIGGTTTLSNFRGGQFTGLSTSYSTMKVMQLDSPNIPLTPSDVEWYWAPNTPPAYADTYKLATSTGCGNKTITFNNWTGDFADENAQTPDLTTKITQTNCNIVISYANSPVTLASFTATPYDNAVLLDWRTSNEWQHRGFNVYRSQLNGDGFVQINTELVRNIHGSLGAHGTYRFVDEDAVNGVIYSYIIEDVPITGPAQRHGPVIAMPMVAYGAVPPATGTPNEGGSDDDADNGNGITPGPIGNDGVIDLGNGVHILARTSNSMRIEIIPPAAVYSPSPWNGSYESVNVPGYSKSLVVGHPEIPERSFLVEVNPSFTTVEVTNAVVTEGAPAAHNIQPAPEYTPDGNGILVPSYSLNASAYSTNSFSPSVYHSVDTALTDVNGKKYVKINVNPLKFNPVTQQTQAVTKIILDIGLDGQAWETDPPDSSLAHAPSAIDGALRVRYSNTGMYEVLYDDLESMGIEGTLSGVNISELRGYFLGEEIALDIFSSDAIFNSGDRIRFWGDVIPKLESNLTEVVITKYDLLGNGVARRFNDLDGNPTLWNSPDPNVTVVTDAKVVVEQDNKFLNDRKLGDLQDHFFWTRLGENIAGNLPYYNNKETFSISLPRQASPPGAIARIIVHVRGRAQLVQESDHHIGLWLNNIPFRVADKVFSGYYKERVVFEVDADYLIPGNNNIGLEVIPDQITDSQDAAYLDIDRIEVEYQAEQIAVNDVHIFYKPKAEQAINIRGFSDSNISIYEISERGTPYKFTNTSISTPDLGATYDILFGFAAENSDAFGYRFVAVGDSGVLQPDSMSIAIGADKALKDTSNQADMIVIGFSDLLDASEDLIAHRRQQGLIVETVDVEQIYSEFSDGIASSQGIKSFLQYAFESWQSPKPKYVLFIGDATFDLKDVQGNSHNGRLLPIAMLSGQFFDFASDSWFVNFDADLEPEMAIGRIPARNTLQAQQYVDKLLAYENGDRSPASENAKSLSFYADADTYWEGFSTKVSELSSLVTNANSNISVNSKTRVATDNASVLKTELIANMTNSTPLVVSLLGHGNEEMWAEEVLTAEDAQAMTNEKLPIVLGLACATGNFYGADLVGDGLGGADPETQFLGEALVMNPDGGAIAYWGSPAYTVPDAQVALARGFLEEVSIETKATARTVRIGDLMLKSKVAVSDIESSADTVNSYALLGDPAMPLPSASFAEASESTDMPSSATEEESKGGGCSSQSGGGSGGCGSVGASGPPPNSGFGGPMATLMLMTMPLFVLLSLRRRRQFNF